MERLKTHSLTDTADFVAAPYRRVPAYLVRRLQMISTSIIAEAFEGEDMSLSEWAVLTIIDNHPDIDQSRLAETVSIDRVNTVSRGGGGGGGTSGWDVKSNGIPKMSAYSTLKRPSSLRS
jgi:hypothetical protein